MKQEEEKNPLFCCCRQGKVIELAGWTTRLSLQGISCILNL